MQSQQPGAEHAQNSGDDRWLQEKAPCTPPTQHHGQHCDCSGVIQISQDLKWHTHIDKGCTSQLRKFNLPQELLKQFYSAIIESVLCTSITVRFGSATKSDIRRLQRTVMTAEWIIGAPPAHPPWTVYTQSEEWLRKSLWILHIQAIYFLNFCHLVGATEHRIPGQPGTRTVFFPQAIYLMNR